MNGVRYRVLLLDPRARAGLGSCYAMSNGSCLGFSPIARELRSTRSLSAETQRAQTLERIESRMATMGATRPGRE